ncbi:TraX family protein [Enterococcus avium]
MFEDYLPLWFRLICYVFGGLTFLIMAYLIVEGYRYTSNFKRYSLRLLIFAIITSVPFIWGMQPPALNVLITLHLGLIILSLSEQMENRLAFYIIFFSACLGLIFMDCGLVGIPMIFLFKKLKGKKRQYFLQLLPSNSIAIFQFVNSVLDSNITMHNSEHLFRYRRWATSHRTIVQLQW